MSYSNPTIKNSTLTVFSVELCDIGTFTCKAANLVSGDSSSGLLAVNGEFVSHICITMEFNHNRNDVHIF